MCDAACRRGTLGFAMRRFFARSVTSVACSWPASPQQRAEACRRRADRPRQPAMEVIVDGVPRYDWRVSTARRGYVTPPGTYHPQMLARSWYSRSYYNSPMPHSIFFYRRLRHPRHLRDLAAGRTGLAWLRAARSGQCRHPVNLVEREGMGRTPRSRCVSARAVERSDSFLLCAAAPRTLLAFCPDALTRCRWTARRSVDRRGPI